jgi:3-dehydroquinate synthase
LGTILDLTAIDFADFDELIYQSVVIKWNRNSRPHWKNRKSLNFGHTLGHAIESYFLRIKQPYYMVKPLLWVWF